MDKLFLMIPEFKKIKTYNLKEAWDDFYEDNPDEADKVHANQMKAFLSDLQDKADRGELDIDIHDNEALSEAFYDYISDKKSYKFSDTAQKAFSKWFNSRKDNYFIKEEIVKVSYDQNKRPEEQSLASRNNMIIDIAYSILTNKDTGPKLLSPGNFDNVKRMDRIAIITGDSITFNKALEVFGQTKETIGEFLLNASLDTLDKFVSNYRKLPNPMTLDNFIHFHYQNMIGAKLIGMYANNTTAQAKFQVTGLSITEDYKWIINGRRMDSLHDIYSPLNELISKNCAEFSAASVDNGKDPTLAGLLQNANTAKLTSVMLRAGMTIEEIGLFFNVPYIKDFIRGTEGNLKKLNFYIDSIDTALKELKASDTVEEVSVKEYSSKEMMSLIVNKFEYSTMSEKDKIDYLKRNKEYLLLLQRIGAVSEDISNLTKISRADSPNGAVDISIAGAKMQTRAVELFHRKIDKGQATITGISDVLVKGLINMDMDKFTIREKLLSSRMPILQAFYSLGIEAANSATSNYFIQNTEFVNSLIDEICDECTTGMMSKSAIERLYKDLIKFGLTKTSLFGDSENSYEEKRNYYLNSYPNIFLSVKSNNPDIANLGIIRKLSVKNGRIVFNRSARMSINAREAFMRDLDSLLYMDNPEAVKLAIDLFMYSYYNEGLSFGPNNYGYFFSSNFLNSFPEFINTLRSMQYEMVKGSFYDKFKLQYLANNFTSLSLPKVNDFTSVNDESIVVERKDVRNHNKSDGSVYEFVVVSGEKGDYLYKTSPKIGGDYIEYTLVTAYGDIYNSYNANKTLEEMRSELAKQSNIRYKNPKAAIEEELSIRTIDDTEYGNFSNIEIDESKLYSHEVSEEVLNELGIPCKNKK